MNTDEITHILKHLLANSRERFLGVFASDKFPRLNSIQSLVPCCYVSNIDPTGKGGSHWVAYFHTRTNRLELIERDGRHPCEFRFLFQNPNKYFISHIKSKPLEPRSVVIFVDIHSLSSSSKLCIAFNM